MEMPLHGPWIAGRKEMDGVARGSLEAGCEIKFGWVVIGGVRPVIGVGTSAVGDGAAVEPVEPSIVTYLQYDGMNGSMLRGTYLDRWARRRQHM